MGGKSIHIRLSIVNECNACGWSYIKKYMVHIKPKGYAHDFLLPRHHMSVALLLVSRTGAMCKRW